MSRGRRPPGDRGRGQGVHDAKLQFRRGQRGEARDGIVIRQNDRRNDFLPGACRRIPPRAQTATSASSLPIDSRRSGRPARSRPQTAQNCPGRPIDATGVNVSFRPGRHPSRRTPAASSLVDEEQPVRRTASSAQRASRAAARSRTPDLSGVSARDRPFEAARSKKYAATSWTLRSLWSSEDPGDLGRPGRRRPAIIHVSAPATE